MFSARDKNDNTWEKLFVIFDNSVFVRTVEEDKNGDHFDYITPADGCYELVGGANICIQGCYISSISGATVYKKQNISNHKRDDFFNEPNFECNKMKFELINKLFVENEKINGKPYQIYIPTYFNVLKLVIYKEDDGKLKAFFFSEQKDIGCSPYSLFAIQEVKKDKTTKKKNKSIPKKDKKNKPASAEMEERRLIHQIAKEGYKKLLIDGYIYLRPMQSNFDIKNSVLSIEGTDVKYISPIPLEFEPELISKNDM